MRKLLKHFPEKATVTNGELIEKLQNYPLDILVAYSWEGCVVPVVLGEMEVMEETDFVHGPVLVLDADTF